MLSKLLPKQTSGVLFINLGLTLSMVGCNGSANNVGGSPNSSSRGLYSQASNSDDDKSSYQGSQAYNSSLFNGENINSQTGTLTMGKSLIARPGVTSDMDLNLNLTYSSSAANIPSVLGLPKGWSYQLSYIIPANTLIHSNNSSANDNRITSVNINGQN